ncbi:MAG: GNAT family N-acetyltransferase [Chthoniobacterales bacterium]|nr:GNAT family N-acetyltransferase [Chthoniobacterales bacterium]
MIVTTLLSHFVWQTVSIPPVLEGSFFVRRARFEEKEKATQVALLGLKMSTEWYDAVDQVSASIEEASQRAFTQQQEPSCLVVAHGGRIIGVSILDCNEEAASHLASGPWVLTEYRNRGIGSLLLQASLHDLAEQGITEVRGTTRTHGVAARFVYPKFGGVKI